MSDRWIALHCGEQTDSLIENHPMAFLLLSQIARRAKWKDCPITKLKSGQAFIGDWKKAGIHSEMAYRHAKTVLETCKLATFRGTNKGTVASLTTTGIFSVSAEQRNGPRNSPITDQGTGQQQASNRPATTNHTDTLIHGHTEHTDTPQEAAGEAAPKKRTARLPTTEASIKISEFYRRRATTQWQAKEMAAFKAIPKDALDELDLVLKYEASERARGKEGWHKRDLATFLNQYMTELDRARDWESQGLFPSQKTTTPAGGKHAGMTDMQFTGEEF